MSEHWKSTPRYWCKHCSCYVRDTKLERQNHEATARHQGALKRFLRELHRGHEREERDKERARQEIARLNGVVAGSSSSSTSSRAQPSQQQSKPAAPSESQLKRQREQLAEMGVAVPSPFLPEMAMPGEWTVTKTRVVETRPEDDMELKEDVKVEAKAIGVRKREVTEEERDEEAAVRGLFKKPRRWGRDSKTMPQENDDELDALLSGSIAPRRQHEADDAATKQDPEARDSFDQLKQEEPENIKTEPINSVQEVGDGVKIEAPYAEASLKPEDDASELGASAVVFKKRKSKGLRQK